MPTDEISSPSTASHSAHEAGQKLAGIYILRDQISDRAEGEIWLAHDEVLGKDVSLHFIPDALRGDARAMGEIRQEIKRNRQLIHPGILRVYDLVEEPEWSAISMDWFEGESLATALKNKAGGIFEPSEIKPWLQQVCHTLDDIHKIHIVHRDVAPHNIFVDARGKVLLAKFGISRVIEDAVARVNKEGGPDRRLASISPQCLDGENPSKADDVYSIGATIYELLTGELPFTGPDLLAQIRKNPPQPMMERRAKLGKGGGTILPVWEKWVAAALAKPTTDRPASAGELAAKLGLSGKLPLESVAPAPAPVPAPAAAAPAPVIAAAPVVASLAALAPETTSDKAPEAPKETAPDLSKETAAPAETPLAGVAAITGAAAVVAAASSSKPVEPEPAAAVEPKIELPVRGPGIKLPPSRFAGVAAAETERKAGDKPEEKPHDKPEEKPRERTEEKAHEKPVASDDGDREIDSKVDAVPDKYEDPAPTAKSSALVFGGLIVLVIALAYFLNRPSKEEPKPASGTPVAQVTPAPSTPREVPEETPRVEAATPKETRYVGEPAGSGPTPARPATPTIAIATPKGTEPVAALTGDPEKDYLNALKQETSANAAVKDAVKALETKGKEITPIVKTGGELLAVRTKRADEVKAAEDAAQAARQTAEAKAKAVDDAKKAQADWEAANGPKLAAYDKASTDFKALEEALAVKKQQAEEATRAVGAADAARRDLTQKAQKEKEEAAKRLAAQKAEEERLANEKKARDQEIDDKIEELHRSVKILEWQKLHPGEPLPAELARPAARTSVVATPGPVVGATPRGIPIATPGPVAGSTPRPIPPPPPSPKPVQQTDNVQRDLLTPSIPLVPATPSVVAVGSTPIKVITSIPQPTPAPPVPATPAPIEVKATPVGGTPVEASTGESSLGLKFSPVGDVAFCVWPTRLQDFDVFAKETGFRNNSWKSPGFRQGPDHPVVNVSWNDAIAFCKWLTDRDRKKGFLTKDQIYRLPTDLEWSKAVGLPEETGKSPEARDMSVPDVFPWGTQWPPPPNVGNYTGEETGSDVAIKGYDDGFAWTSPVGTFPANKYGLYDVGGNVWQWCMDNWSNESKAKVLRGASWYNGALKLSLLSSCRVSANPESSTDNYGFRVVRASERSGRPR